MRRPLAPALLTLATLAVAGPLRAADPPEKAAAPSEADRVARHQLKLGLYGRPSAPQTALKVPRFESSVEVVAPAPAQPDPNATMSLYWRHWNLSTGSIYGKGRNVNRGCPTCVNILPLVEKVIDKLK